MSIFAQMIFGSEDWDQATDPEEIQQYDFVFPEVYADDAFKICQVPFREPYRVMKYVEYRQHLDAEQREDMINRGGQVCSRCSALFLPAGEEPWTKAGFCRKVCFEQAFADFSKGQE